MSKIKKEAGYGGCSELDKAPRQRIAPGAAPPPEGRDKPLISEGDEAAINRLRRLEREISPRLKGRRAKPKRTTN